MSVSSRVISAERSYQFEYTFCTLMTNPQEYAEMLESAVHAGFDEKNTEFLCMDNSNGNQFDGYSGINRAIVEAKGRYLIFCHQDVLFCFDKKPVLDGCLQELSKIDPRWAVAGNAGKDSYARPKMRITDPNFKNISCGEFPAKVMTLDENLLIFNMKNHVFCSTDLAGFHLYGSDFCLNSSYFNLNSYVIDFHLKHKSAGRLSEDFFLAKKDLIRSHMARKRSTLVFSTCDTFYIGRNLLMSFVLNRFFKGKFFYSIFKRLFNSGRS